jgi:hypothetical protein
MVSEATKPQRPGSITLISIFEIYSAFLALYYIIRIGVQELGMESTLLFAFGGMASFVCGVGFWLMKRWALWVYIAYAVVNQVALLVLGRWNVFSLLIPVLVIYIVYRNRSKFS